MNQKDKELTEQLKKLVNPAVFEVVDKATGGWIRAGKIHTMYTKLEDIQEDLKTKKIHQWNLRLEVNNMNLIAFHDQSVLAKEVWEAILQLLSLLEAIHYSERKEVINNFNNSLKEYNDGKSTEE